MRFDPARAEEATPVAPLRRDYIHHEHVAANFAVTDIGNRTIVRCRHEGCGARWTLDAAQAGDIAQVLEILSHGYAHRMAPKEARP